MRPSKRQKYKLDPKKFETGLSSSKKKKDWEDNEIFDEILRTKSRRRH